MSENLFERSLVSLFFEHRGPVTICAPTPAPPLTAATLTKTIRELKIQMEASERFIRAWDANEEDLAFRWLAARRDYPYDLSLRVRPHYIHPTIFERCLVEFTRSNPGFTL